MSMAALSYAANGSTNFQSEGSRTMHQQQMNKAQSEMQQKTTPSDCSQLSEQEKQFASKLSQLHRKIFCLHFTRSQRIRAMALNSPEVEALMGEKTMITPDEAVEDVIKDARQDQPAGKGSDSQQSQQQNPYSNYSYPNGGSSNQGSSNPYSNQ